MEYSINYLEADGIIHVKTSADLTWDTVKRLSIETLALGRKNGVHKFLVDYRDSDIDLSILEIDDLPTMFREIGVGFDDRIAVLFDSSSPKKSLFLFFQNVSFLRSLQFRVFTDQGKALAWLKSAPKSEMQNGQSHPRQHKA